MIDSLLSPGAFRRLVGLVALICGAMACGGTAASATPRAVAVWPAGPMEVKVAFDGPIDPAVARAMVGRTIPFGEPDQKKPGPRLVQALGRLRIAAARLDDAGRTLVLTTDPHPRQATYVLTVPVDDTAGKAALQGGVPLAYDLGGVEVSWTEGRDGAGPASTSWWPQVDPESSHVLAGRSVEPARPGRLTVRTLLLLPKGKVTVRFESDAPAEATLAADPPRSNATSGGRHRVEWELEFDRRAGRAGGDGPDRRRWQGRGVARRLPDPGRPHRPAGSREMAARALDAAFRAGFGRELADPVLAGGGDARRGEAVFNGAEAKCSACHQVGGRGGQTGPALDDLADRDPASVYRDIAEPSAVIDPDYLPYTVALKDGRVAAGVVRAEGADAIRVHDVNGRATIIPRSEVEELRPAARRSCPSDWPVRSARPGCATSSPS